MVRIEVEDVRQVVREEFGCKGNFRNRDYSYVQVVIVNGDKSVNAGVFEYGWYYIDGYGDRDAAMKAAEKRAAELREVLA